eukprot:COSAG02_NODE_4029_length_5885_cov_88.549430_5_plen_161_part_00
MEGAGRGLRTFAKPHQGVRAGAQGGAERVLLRSTSRPVSIDTFSSSFFPSLTATTHSQQRFRQKDGAPGTSTHISSESSQRQLSNDVWVDVGTLHTAESELWEKNATKQGSGACTSMESGGRDGSIGVKFIDSRAHSAFISTDHFFASYRTFVRGIGESD